MTIETIKCTRCKVILPCYHFKKKRNEEYYKRCIFCNEKCTENRITKLCKHGKQKSICIDCGGSNICEHNRQKTHCKECGGSQICEHDKIRSSCKECRGSSICEHNRRRNICKECGGSSICDHDKIRSSCKECGGSSICKHNIHKNSCKECGGSSICEHNIHKQHCKKCNGYSICSHNKDKNQCNKCSPNSNKFCKECHFTMVTKKYKGYCVSCYVHNFPEDELSKTARLKYDELKVKVFIASEFPKIFTYNARIVLGDCDAPYYRYIDFYVMLGNTLFAIEVDENQHKRYNKEDEEARINEILHNIGLDKKMVFIRFNPSPYKIDGKSKRTSYEKRLIKLKETVQEVFSYLKKNEEYPDIHTEIKLFFDQ